MSSQVDNHSRTFVMKIDSSGQVLWSKTYDRGVGILIFIVLSILIPYTIGVAFGGGLQKLGTVLMAVIISGLLFQFLICSFLLYKFMFQRKNARE